MNQVCFHLRHVDLVVKVNDVAASSGHFVVGHVRLRTDAFIRQVRHVPGRDDDAPDPHHSQQIGNAAMERRVRLNVIYI